MKAKILKLSVVVVVSLFVMMPIYTASVFARFGAVDIKGDDGLSGYIREDDYLDFTVDAVVEDDTDITPNQVRFVTVKANFTRCIGPNMDGSFTCTLRYPPADTTHFSMNEFPVTLQLFDDYGDMVDAYFKLVTIDKEPPSVTLFDVNPKSTSNENLTFSYIVHDYAFSVTNTNKCSGISYIQLYAFDDALIKRVDFDGSECSVRGEIVIENSKFDEGTNVVYAKAEDMFGQESRSIYTSFNIDRTPVDIESDVQVLDTFGNGILYIGEQGVSADIIVEIIGSDLNRNTVEADFSDLNAEIDDYVEQAECDEREEGIYECVWEGIEIMPGSTGSKNIKVTAYDYSGNVRTKTLTYGFIFDNEGPTITEIKTDNAIGPISFAKKEGNRFTAILTETGIGIDPLDIRLHLGVFAAGDILNEQGFPRPADSCDPGWTCVWDDVNLVNQGEFAAYIGMDSVDKLGNPVKDFFSDVIADFTEPELVSINITPLGGALPAFADYVKTYDSLQITAVVREDTLLKDVYGDFSAIIRDATQVSPDGCTEGNGTYTCTWQTSPIDVTGYITDELKFYFGDQAGNVLEVSEPIEIYEVTNLSLDFWRHKVSCSPKHIDRQTTALINHRLYCHVSLSSSEAESIAINLVGCEGKAAQVLEEDPILFNGQAGSTDPYIKFVLRAENMAYESLDFKCNLNIISKVGTKISRYPELEEVTMSVPLYNMPIGTYGQGILDLIEESKDFAWFIGDWVEDLNNLFHYGEALCKTLGTLAQLGNTLGAIGAALGITAKTTATTGVGVPASRGIDRSRESIQRAQQGVGGLTKKAWGNSLVKFCKFFSCRLFYDDIGKTGDEKGTIRHKLGAWQKKVLVNANWVAKGGREGGTEVWGNKATGYETGPIQGAKLGPKDSIIISTLTLCLPGIVYNLNKLRQIQCMYITCLQTNAVQGLPLSACEVQKHYATCKYWWGEIFQLLPFTGLINYITGLIKQILSSPWGFVDTSLAFVCEYAITQPYGTGAYLCLINDLAGLIANVYTDLEGIGESWKIQEDYCSNI